AAVDARGRLASPLACAPRARRGARRGPARRAPRSPLSRPRSALLPTGEAARGARGGTRDRGRAIGEAPTRLAGRGRGGPAIRVAGDLRVARGPGDRSCG